MALATAKQSVVMPKIKRPLKTQLPNGEQLSNVEQLPNVERLPNVEQRQELVLAAGLRFSSHCVALKKTAATKRAAESLHRIVQQNLPTSPTLEATPPGLVTCEANLVKCH
jgi:hypothetical protein